jgi:hypothetical protein
VAKKAKVFIVWRAKVRVKKIKELKDALGGVLADS